MTSNARLFHLVSCGSEASVDTFALRAHRNLIDVLRRRHEDRCRTLFGPESSPGRHRTDMEESVATSHDLAMPDSKGSFLKILSTVRLERGR